MSFQPNGILVELDKNDFLEIVQDFIRQRQTEYKNFCKGVAG